MKVQQVTLVAVALSIALFVLPRIGTGNPPLTATVEFGQNAEPPNVGSPFPPVPPHDQSAHAKDNLVPRTVVISQGGSVTFNIGPFHQVAIYEPGTKPEDIEVSPATLEDLGPLSPCLPFVLPDLVINDTVGRTALGPSHSCSLQTWTVTFDEPGRYLVICTTLPHFDVGMFGWVIVE
jgi:plastocyanin